MSTSKDKMVPLDYELQDICWKALRYDWGRHTASTGDAARTIIKHVPYFSDSRLEGMRVDLLNMIKERERWVAENGGKPLGLEIYEHDVQPFVDLAQAIRKHLTEVGYYDKNR